MVWGSKQEYYPYLLGVTDTFESLVHIPGYSWTREYTADELAAQLNAKGYDCSTIVSAKVATYSETGNPATVTFEDSRGKLYTLTAIAMQKVFPFQSWRYDFANAIEIENRVNDETVIENFNGMYTIDGNGNIIPLDNGAYVITDNGVSPAITGGVASGDVFIFEGKGYGHNVGMSQYGAYSMAKLGYTFDEILTFYYTGLEVK
jgi:stage II sporulation protein D